VVAAKAASFSSGVAVARRASREAEHDLAENEASSGQLMMMMMMMMMMMHRDGETTRTKDSYSRPVSAAYSRAA
jgi:hypothetical protein